MKNRIEYGTYVFDDDHIDSGNLFLAASLLSSQLQVNSFNVTVRCADPSILDFERNSKLTYYFGGRQRGVFCVQSIERVAPQLYEITATSVLGLLTEGQHMGGIYTGQTAEEVIGDICGSVPYIVKTVLAGIKLYGWLPIATPRDNLSQVLFAIGAALKTDLDGVLRIAGLWDGISGQAPEDKMYEDATVDYSAKITQVIVTEHQYIAGNEEKQLFEGTAQAGDVITFDEPMHSLTATGFSIQASGANWARVSAGTGTLTGKTYIHNTRQVTRDVQQAAAPNVKTVEDATLVSLVNASAVAQRLADYYKCRQRVDAQVVYSGELPGDRLATYHPFDKVGVDACMESADIAISNTLAAKEKLLVGYVPPQIENVEYFDQMVVITESGQWTVPDGVTRIRYVLIGGGDGGQSGSSGKSGGSGKNGSTTSSRGTPGTGGQPGAPGSGGKILQGDLNVNAGQVFSVSIGQGGSSNSRGGATTFGAFSSESGSSSPSGYTEITTGTVYATPGVAGIKGGDGGGQSMGPNVVYNGVTYHSGTSYGAFSSSGVTVVGGAGGGAAAGADGYNGSAGRIYSTTCFGGSGGNGASAVAGDNAHIPGGGGGGGNGGGGGGGGGGGVDSEDILLYKGSGGSGGQGGAGGYGAAGLVLLYYTLPKKTGTGQLVDKNGKMVLDRFRRRVIV